MLLHLQFNAGLGAKLRTVLQHGNEVTTYRMEMKLQFKLDKAGSRWVAVL